MMKAAVQLLKKQKKNIERNPFGKRDSLLSSVIKGFFACCLSLSFEPHDHYVPYTLVDLSNSILLILACIKLSFLSHEYTYS